MATYGSENTDDIGLKTRRLRSRNGCAILLLALLLSACVGAEIKRSATLAPVRAAGANEALLSVFLHLAKPASAGLWMEVDSVALVGENTVVPLDMEATPFGAGEILGGQRFVARGPVAPGRYSALRLTINKAALIRQSEKLFLAVPEPVVELPLPADFRLEAGMSRSLFLAWDEEASVRNRAFFVPSLAVLPEQFPLLADLAYVSCPDIDTVYLVRTDNNRVCGSLAIRGTPTYMAYDADKKRLYVLAAKDAAICVVEAATSRIIDRIKIPMSVNPSYLVTNNGKWGYVLDEDGDSLFKIDLLQGTLDRRVRLGDKPRFMLWVPDREQLAISSGLSQTVYLLDPETLATRSTVLTGNGPDGLLVTDNYLYVAESASNTVGIYDVRSGQLSKRLNVGFKPRRLVQNDNRIYISNSLDNTISLLAIRQQTVVRDIRVGGGPLEMAVSARHKWVYVAEQATGRLAVVDQTAGRVVQHVELGTKPQHLLVVQ
ncbi:MAG: YncE family protein [Desulfurivibrionaceae bacterium]|nr:YncE family protein [Desulfurivibrionaceae bacterium]